MAVKILMPALSPTMEHGTISNWLVKEGDNVSAGDVLLEIETDKATMEVEAVDEGVISKILLQDGTEDVPINTVIAVLKEEGDNDGDVEKLLKKSSAPSGAPASPPAPAHAENAPATPPPVSASASSRIFASPLARRKAKEYGIDLTHIKGSAAHGRIVLADIEQAKKSPIMGAPSSASPLPSSSQNYQQTPLSDMPSYDEMKPDNIRKTIARRLLQSKQQVPHFYLTAKANITAMTQMRSQYNARFDDRAQKISINDFIIKAAALALKAVPAANSAWIAEGEQGNKSDLIRTYHRADISVAVSTDGGLITPIIRDADNKPLALISNEMKQLAKRARDGALQPAEYQGGTFTISNLGMYGIDEFKAIINPPQGAILAVGAAVRMPIYDSHGHLVPADILSLSLSADHRVVDGVVGAQYLQSLVKNLENPLWLFL